MKKQRETFNSKIGILLSLVGAAVGLGNMWRFPYLLGTSGGAAFLIIYLIIILVLCFPMMLAEFHLGKFYKADSVTAYSKASNPHIGKFAGILNFFACYLSLSFYIVVGGWIVKYFIGCFDFHTNFAAENIQGFMLDAMGVNSAWLSSEVLLSLGCAYLFLIASALITLLGIGSGIEKFSKVTMPFLFVVILLMAVYSITLPGSFEGIRFMFSPDFSQIDGSTVAKALGQACMSLCIGMGMILTYASYSKDNVNQITTSIGTVIADTGFAIISGLAIIPAIFAFNASQGANLGLCGPELVFYALPQVFSHIGGGILIAPIFFFSLIIAALSSAIALLEMMGAVIMKICHVQRRTAILIGTAMTVVSGALCSFSFGPLQNVSIFGNTIFDTFDFAASDIFTTLGALVLALVVGWKVRKEEFIESVTGGNPKYHTIGAYSFFIIRWVAPAAISTVMILGIFAK